MNTQLAAFVLRALVAWNPRAQPDVLRVWADAMAGVCTSERECARLASVATEESHFVAWVLDQSCNDADWRRAHGCDRCCDSGKSVGPFQVQDDRFRGASVEFQVSVSLEKMRAFPGAWATWAKASAVADEYVARRRR